MRQRRKRKEPAGRLLLFFLPLFLRTVELWKRGGQCFQMFGFQIFGFGFPNSAKTSDFEYRIRSFMHQEKATKGGILPKKSSWSNEILIKHHTFDFERKTGLFFYPYKRRNAPNPNSNIRSNIRISKTELLRSNIRFFEYEYSSLENTGGGGREGMAVIHSAASREEVFFSFALQGRRRLRQQKKGAKQILP